MILSSLPFENNEITIEKVMAGIMLLFVYFIPTIISWNKKNSKFVIAFNTITAWTILGWLIAFVWALNISRQHKVVLAEEKKKRKKMKRDKLKSVDL